MRMNEKAIEKLIEKMPHGSGIDYDYEWTKSNGKLILHNAFHNMDEMGGYDGLSYFKVHLIFRNDGEWILDKIRFAKSITVSSIYSKYSDSTLRDYLYDTFQWTIDEYNQKVRDFNDSMVNFDETEKRMRVDEDYHTKQNSLYAMGDNPKF